MGRVPLHRPLTPREAPPTTTGSRRRSVRWIGFVRWRPSSGRPRPRAAPRPADRRPRSGPRKRRTSNPSPPPKPSVGATGSAPAGLSLAFLPYSELLPAEEPSEELSPSPADLVEEVVERSRRWRAELGFVPWTARAAGPQRTLYSDFVRDEAEPSSSPLGALSTRGSLDGPEVLGQDPLLPAARRSAVAADANPPSERWETPTPASRDRGVLPSGAAPARPGPLERTHEERLQDAIEWARTVFERSGPGTPEGDLRRPGAQAYETPVVASPEDEARREAAERALLHLALIRQGQLSRPETPRPYSAWAPEYRWALGVRTGATDLRAWRGPSPRDQRFRIPPHRIRTLGPPGSRRTSWKSPR